jgi:hypothetical protein
MRQMGLIGAVDHDTSTIHENEPTQAVFFEPSTIKVLEVIHNEAPQRGVHYYTERAFSEWAEDVENHTKEVVGELKHSISQYLTRGGSVARSRMFAMLSWLQYHVKRYSPDWGPGTAAELIEEIRHFREVSPPNVKQDIVDKLIQFLQRVR